MYAKLKNYRVIKASLADPLCSQQLQHPRVVSNAAQTLLSQLYILPPWGLCKKTHPDIHCLVLQIFLENLCRCLHGPVPLEFHKDFQGRHVDLGNVQQAQISCSEQSQSKRKVKNGFKQQGYKVGLPKPGVCTSRHCRLLMLGTEQQDSVVSLPDFCIFLFYSFLVTPSFIPFGIECLCHCDAGGDVYCEFCFVDIG